MEFENASLFRPATLSVFENILPTSLLTGDEGRKKSEGGEKKKNKTRKANR